MKSKYQKYQKNKLRNPKEMEKAHQEKLRKKAISELEPRYKIYRKKAIQEERMDFAGEEEVSIVGRDALFDILKKLFDLNARISDTDISLIKNAFYTHPEFIAKEKLKFIIDVAYKGGFEEASSFTHTFKRIYGVTPSQYREQR